VSIDAHFLHLTETNQLNTYLYERLHALLGETARLQEQVARQQQEVSG
jgi:hypothetical protein